MAAEIRKVPAEAPADLWQRFGEALVAIVIGAGGWLGVKRIRNGKSSKEASSDEPAWASRLIDAIRDNTMAVHEMRDAIKDMDHKLEKVHDETSAAIASSFSTVLLKIADMQKEVAVALAGMKR